MQGEGRERADVQCEPEERGEGDDVHKETAAAAYDDACHNGTQLHLCASRA